MNRKIEKADVRWGDFHIHTCYTDGKNTVQDYCSKAQQDGLKTIAFTEHVRKKLSYDYQTFLFDIQRARDAYTEMEILSGCETKVLNTRGELDVSERVLEECDVVIGVFHRPFCSTKKDYINALKEMLQNPYVDIWGHPTLFAARNGVTLSELELDDILTVCKDENVLVEKNFRYHVPNPHFVQCARERGVGLILGSDAHNVHDLLTIQRIREEWNRMNRMC